MANASTIFRDFVTDGVPASGKHKVKKSDVRAWGTDIEERAGKYIFNNEEDFEDAIIPAIVMRISTRGYYEPDDEGGHDKIRLLATPSPVEAWHKQSADGAWWQACPVDGAYNGPQFSAKGDGTTDDTEAWQAALDAAEELLVNKVWVPVPAVAYKVEGIFIGDRVELDGVPFKSLFRLSPDAPVGANIITNKTHTGSGNIACSVRNCVFDGNRTNRDAADATPRPGYSCILFANVTYGVIEGNYCYDGILHGINLSSHSETALGNGSSEAHWYTTGSKKCTVRGNYVTNCGDDGITTHYTYGCLITGNYCWDMGGTGSGLDTSDNTNGIESDDGSRFDTITGNFCWNTVIYNDTDGNRLTRDGIQAKGHDDTPAPQGIKITDNHIWNCYRGVHAWHRGYDESTLSPSAIGLVVSNNTVSNCLADGIRVSRYAMFTVTGNYVTDVGENPYIFTLGARRGTTDGNIALDCTNATYAYNYTDTCLGEITHTGNNHDNCPRAVRVTSKMTCTGNRGNCRSLLVGSSGIFIPTGTDNFVVANNNIEGADFPILNQAGWGVSKICGDNVGQITSGYVSGRGWWRMQPDGTLHQWLGENNERLTLAFSSTATLNGTWTYPVAFADEPKVSAILAGSVATVAPSTSELGGARVGSTKSTTACEILLLRRFGGTDFVAGNTLTVECEAIGRAA